MQAETERLQHRPDLPNRGASDPVTPEPKSNMQIDRDLRKLIRKGPSTKKKHRESGEIYLFTIKSATTDVELLKLGRTQADTDTRRKQIKSVCKVKQIGENKRAISENVPFHGYAEKLAHTELVNFRHHWDCTCGREHQEYFDVSEDVALEVFERWRDFCNKKPWTSDGKILPVWEQRLNDWKPTCSGREHEFDHSGLAKNWSEFTSHTPTTIELYVSDAIRLWEDVFPERWQIVAIAELLTIICISPISFWITTWAVVIGSLLLIDLVPTNDLHIFKRIREILSSGSKASNLGGDGKRNGRNDSKLSPSPEGHGLQTPIPREQSMRGLGHLPFTAMQLCRSDDANIVADSSPGAYPNEYPGVTDCESDMEDEGFSSPCAERASRRGALDVMVTLASANPEITVDEDPGMVVVE
ncbi:hypothetical protein CGCTS75_v007244 [Colletotrichum tropicale]|nr:hypothetical protein CGCTS75_v007244 [Colletotrichum tropicale]